MNESVLILAAGLILIYGAFSRLATRSIVTPPMAFMLVGVLCSPMGLGLFELKLNEEAITLLAEIALIIVVCSDASQVDRRMLSKIESVPIRLLFIGLPLTMVLGAGLAALTFDGFKFAALALLAVVLSPTDAALGQAVITSDAVPEPVREAINVESGLNDGIALPPIFAILFLLGADMGHAGAHGWAAFAALQILLGPVAGALVGIGGGRLVDFAAGRGWLDPSFGRMTLPAIALLAYALAGVIGGNGFIAAFVSGLTLAVKTPSVREQITDFGETEGTVLSLLLFLVLGLVMVPAVVDRWSVTTTIYAILSLTVARMLPVAISLIGLKVDFWTAMFIGWFGPRGIASILYLLLLVKYLGIHGYETLIATGIETIVLSVLLHGLTAAPLARLYGDHVKVHGLRHAA